MNFILFTYKPEHINTDTVYVSMTHVQYIAYMTYTVYVYAIHINKYTYCIFINDAYTCTNCICIK